MTIAALESSSFSAFSSSKENNEEKTKSITHEKMPSFVRSEIKTLITKQVIRKKLVKMRHLLVSKAFDPDYLDSLFPRLIALFNPQTVVYNGGIAKVPEWKISCYLEVMYGGVPTTEPNIQILNLMTPLLEQCNNLFLHWYKQQHACNFLQGRRQEYSCERLMTFVTRYTPAPGEQALLKHVDGAGKVDGSLVVALPMETGKEFEGGGLTVWDGKDSNKKTLETHYDTRNGDAVFLDRAVWHQADPITKGTRWALVIFYKVHKIDRFSLSV